MSRLNPKPDRIAIANAHFDRNIALAEGHQAAPYVTYAESVLVVQKDKGGFQQMLRQALKIDVNTWPASPVESPDAAARPMAAEPN